MFFRKQIYFISKILIYKISNDTEYSNMWGVAGIVSTCPYTLGGVISHELKL